MEILYQNLLNITWQQVVMWMIGGVLIYLAIKKDMEPSLLLPIGFGAILVNLPLSGAVTQITNGIKEVGALDVLFNAGIANELFPLILFIGIGAMIDFGPLLSNPKLMLFGAAAQFGIFFTLCLASMFFDLKDAAYLAQHLAGWENRTLHYSITAALQQQGYYEPLFQKAIANEGNKALLAKALQKAKSGKNLTVVGLGGSITLGTAWRPTL